jgi:hypothetical protein
MGRVQNVTREVTGLVLRAHLFFIPAPHAHTHKPLCSLIARSLTPYTSSCPTEEADAHHHASIMGGLRGGFGGAVVSSIVFPILYRTTNYYRTLPAPLKAFG